MKHHIISYLAYIPNITLGLASFCFAVSCGPMGNLRDLSKTRLSRGDASGEADLAGASTEAVAVKIIGLPHTLVETGIGDGSPCSISPPNPGAKESRFWVPDGPPRAYQDNQGRIRLIAPHYRTFPLVGSSLDDVQVDCNDIISESNQNGDPNQFDDASWLWSPYRLDDGRAIAIYHHEHHFGSHNQPCQGGSCWYAAMTLGIAQDGVHFARANDRVIARAPQAFNGMDGVPKGYSDHTNIARNPADGKYYVVAMRHDPTVRDCVMRSDNLLDAHSWRTWDGNSYNGRPADGGECVDFTSRYGSFAPGSLTFSDYLGRFVFLAFGDVPGKGQGFFMFLAQSDDLSIWGPPVFVMEAPLPWGENPAVAGRSTWFYPSFLDPNGAPNFDHIGERPYLYFIYGPSRRKLTRVPVQFVRGAQEQRNRGEGLYRVGGSAYFSNGFNQFCGVTSMDHLRALGWSYPFENLAPFNDHGTLTDAGACSGAPQSGGGNNSSVPRAAGCYRIAGGGYWSNGSGQSCVVAGPFLAQQCGEANFNRLPERSSHEPNILNGGCILPAGCYRVGPTGYYSNGQGHSCPFLGEQMPRICNGLTTERFNFLPAIDVHMGNQVDGQCQ